MKVGQLFNVARLVTDYDGHLFIGDPVEICHINTTIGWQVERLSLLNGCV